MAMETATATTAQPIELSPKQWEFLCLDEPLGMFCGGVGSGKTRSGAMWAIDKAIQHPRCCGLIAANTYLQLHKSTLPPFFAMLRANGVKFTFGKRPYPNWPTGKLFQDYKNVITLHNGAQILTYSLENYDVIRGVEIGWF